MTNEIDQENWIKTTWGAISSLKYGKSLKDYKDNQAGIPVFGTNGKIGYTNKALCQNPGVIIGRKGAYRGVHFSDEPFFVIDTAFYLVPDEKFLDAKYAYYKLLTEDINSMDSGSAIPSTSRSDFYQMSLSLPSIREQKAISKILSSIDHKIELNRRMNETLEQIGQAIFKRWFIDFEFPDENGNPYKSSGGEMTESELGEIPEGWKIHTLKDCIEVSKGLSYHGEGLSSTGTPMHNLNSIYEGGGYKYEGIKYYNGDYKEKHMVQPGDIILANTEQGHKYRLIGFPAVIPQQYGDSSIFSHHLFRVRTKDRAAFSHQYLYYLLISPYVHEQVIGCTNGTTVNMLYPDGLELPVFILPSKNVMAHYTEIVNNLWKQKEENYKAIQVLTQIRDLLLPKLMSGSIRV